MARSLDGGAVIVTGASLGVGLATAQALARAGAHVVLVARRPEPLQEALATLDGGADRHLVMATDVGDGAALQALVDATVQRFGRLDGLVNNAGAHFRGPALNQPADKLATMVDVNLRAPIALSRMALPHLVQTQGFIVNVASLAGRLPLDGAATYSATKFGLRAFSLALREEVRDQGVDICVVSPGPIDTGFILDDIDQVDDIVFSQAMCSAEHVADMILDCARDGVAERAWPPTGAKLATLSYLVPGLRRKLKPLLKRKGARTKERLKREGRTGPQ